MQKKVVVFIVFIQNRALLYKCLLIILQQQSTVLWKSLRIIESYVNVCKYRKPQESLYNFNEFLFGYSLTQPELFLVMYLRGF